MFYYPPDGSCLPATQGRRAGTGRSRQCTGRPEHHHHEEEEEEEDEYDDDDDFTDIALIFYAVLPEVPHRELLSNHLEENKRVRKSSSFLKSKLYWCC